ncbi:MAG: molybdopterin molybdotransferase MoeA [Pseudomonadota bacterium]
MDQRSAPDLRTAQRLILDQTSALPVQFIPLEEALHCVPSRPLPALLPSPGFNHSTRDGFVLSARAVGEGHYRITGEIAAGDICKNHLAAGEAWRIMTGAQLPAGKVRVIPQEQCTVEGDILLISSPGLPAKDLYIRKKGSNIAQGKIVVPAGTPIQPEHQALLAGVGYTEVPVHRRPRVSFFCTGNELAEPTATKLSGQKVSENRFLLNSLTQLSGAIPTDCGLVGDNKNELRRVFATLAPDQTDVIISTGGMGPGKYDLLEDAFIEADGHLLYNSLRIRPGKATLFGTLGQSLFFGLPGPPPAVHLLLHELVRPALLALQGIKRNLPESVRIRLSEPINCPEQKILCFKSGIFQINNGICTARLARKSEVTSCYLLCPAHRRQLRAGDWIQAHLTSSPFRG